MTSLDWTAEFVKLELCLTQTSKHATRNLAEIMVFQLLMLRWNHSNERAARHFQIGSHIVDVSVNEKEFLLSAES